MVRSQDPSEAEAPLELDDVLKGGSPHVIAVEKIASYVDRLGASLDLSPQGHVFVNGKHFDMDDVQYFSSAFSRF